MRRATLLVLVLGLVAALAPATAFAQGPFGSGNSPFGNGSTQAQVIYDSTINPLPPHMPSLAFQSTQTGEIGDEVTFAGTERDLQSVTVTLDSYACESGGLWNSTACATTPGDTFSQPVTLNLYDVGNGVTPGSLITSVTQTFNIPYRPSASPDQCNAGNSKVGYWYDSATSSCNAGMATNITFTFNGSVTLPDTLIWGVQLNTSTYGPDPYGTQPCSSTPQQCPYDGLNVDLNPSVSVGSKPFPGTIFWDTQTASYYCDSGTNGTGVFRLDSPGGGDNACWYDNNNDPQIPAVQFVASSSSWFSWAWDWWQQHAPFLFHTMN